MTFLTMGSSAERYFGVGRPEEIMIRPTSKEAGEYFHEVARYFAERGEQEMARFAYRNSIQSWYEATLEQPVFIEYLRAAEEDFSEFAKNDPVYIELLKIVKAYAIQYPGIKESVLSTILDRYRAEDLNYVIHFGQKHGEIVQTKKGEIFGLRMPPDVLRPKGP